MLKKDEFLSALLEAVSDATAAIDGKTIKNFFDYFHETEEGHYEPVLVSIDMGNGLVREIPKIAFVDIETIRIRQMTVQYSTDLTLGRKEMRLSGSNGLKRKGVNINVELNIETGHVIEAIERLKHDLLENTIQTKKEKN